MVYDKDGQPWCLVRVVRKTGTEFLELIPGARDVDVLGVFAWALFPDSKEILYHGHVLKNPVRSDRPVVYDA